MNFSQYIRSIPDHPKPGIIFRDITTLLQNPKALHDAADEIIAAFAGKPVDKVVVVESRGFLLGGLIAYHLGAGLVIIRKKGRLPYRTLSADYTLEYGTDTIEMHEDAVGTGEHVLLHDDLLATGGTMCAAAELVLRSGGVITGSAFLIELDFLNGRQVLARSGISDVFSLIHYQSE